jgi:nucleoside-diphosphate-sugar epimerase
MKVFLTGASGYVGSAVAERLKGRGYKVTGLARSDESAAKLEEKRIEVLRGSLEDFELLKTAASDADAVVHTAFSHSFDDYDDAVRLDREVIKSFADSMARTNKPLIVTSSSAVLGDTRSAIADEDFPYGEASPRRLRGEAELDALQLSSKGIRSIVLRLPLFVYGRGGSSFVPFVIDQAKKNGAANYVEPGEQKVSAVHINDVSDLYFIALDTTTAKGLYNVSGEHVSLKQLNESVARLLGIRARGITAEKAKEQFGKMFDFLSISNQLDSSRAKIDLRWSPSDYLSILDEIENGSYRIFKD